MAQNTAPSSELTEGYLRESRKQESMPADGSPIDLDYPQINLPQTVSGKPTIATRTSTLSSESTSPETEIQQIRSQLTNLLRFNEQLRVENTALFNQLLACCDRSEDDPADKARLFQNVPNPAEDRVKIDYFLPQTYTHATIRLCSAEGKTVLEFNRLLPGMASLEIETEELRPGFYVYYLYAMEKILDSKIMLIQ